MRMVRFQEAGLAGVVLLMGVILAVYGYYDAPAGQPNTFLNSANLVDGIATPMSIYAIMAVGMTLVIISGGIDLSVGSIMMLSGMVTAYALDQFPREDASWMVGPVSVLLPIGVGVACGLVNGLLIVGLRLHPFIVTLGTMTIFRGIGNVLPFGSKTLPFAGARLPEGSVTHLFREEFFEMRLTPLIVMLLCGVVGWVYLRLMVWGRETYAVGGNEQAARFSGINVSATKLRVYVASGALAGLAGLVSLGRFGTISTQTGSGYELTVVAAAVVGGASLIGGRGTALGALLGTLILAMIENGISILRLNQEYKSVIVGTAIIIAVVVDRLGDLLRRRSDRPKV